MGALDKEYLLSLRNQALVERQKYLDMIQQANGAIAIMDVLINELENKAKQNQTNLAGGVFVTPASN
jgi:hypothetical protein